MILEAIDGRARLPGHLSPIFFVTVPLMRADITINHE